MALPLGGVAASAFINSTAFPVLKIARCENCWRENMSGLNPIRVSISRDMTDIMNHTQSVITQDVLALNEEHFEGYQWIAVLDSKTCLVCGKLDNRIFRRLPNMKGGGDKAPDQPIHENCRCVVAPVLEGTSNLMASGPSYEDWFNRQSRGVQIDILGPSRYKLFREGKISITEFTRDNQILDLKQLGAQRVTRKNLLNEHFAATAMRFEIDTIPKTVEEFAAWLSKESPNIGSQATLDTRLSLWKKEMKRLGLEHLIVKGEKIDLAHFKKLAGMPTAIGTIIPVEPIPASKMVNSIFTKENIPQTAQDFIQFIEKNKLMNKPGFMLQQEYSNWKRDIAAMGIDISGFPKMAINIRTTPIAPVLPNPASKKASSGETSVTGRVVVNKLTLEEINAMSRSRFVTRINLNDFSKLSKEEAISIIRQFGGKTEGLELLGDGVVQELAHQLSRMEERFPGFTKTQTLIIDSTARLPTSPGALGWYSGAQKTITIADPRYGGSISALRIQIQKSFNARWNSSSNPMKTTIHEFGHAFHNQVDWNHRTRRSIMGESTTMEFSDMVKNIVRNHMESMGKNFDDVFITNNLSEYATTNSSEFVAEAFAEFITSNNPRPIANIVGGIMKRVWNDHGTRL